MARRFVYGSYLTFDEADVVVDQLVQQGIREDSVAIVANDTSNVPDMYSKQVLTLNRTEETSPEEEDSWWENLFGFLKSDEYDATNDQQATDFGIDYRDHQSSLNRGEFLVVVDSSYESLLESNRYEAGSADYVRGAAMENEVHQGPLYNDMDSSTERDGLDLDMTHDHTHHDTDSESIKLHEERVNVDTHREQVGEVRVTKEVVEDTEVIEVPVQREEVHITHVHPTDSTADDSTAFVEETIEIPISEERVDISKETVVTDEVRIDRDVEETVEEVTETTRREVIDVEDTQRLNHDHDSLTTDRHRSDLLDDDDLNNNLTN